MTLHERRKWEKGNYKNWLDDDYTSEIFEMKRNNALIFYQ